MAPLQIPPQGNFAAINGMEMYYECHGEGSPLLLLHNFSGSTQTWTPFIDPFAAHYRLIIPDLRGHGRSTNPSNHFTHRQAALDIAALLDHLQIDRFDAIGISSGGMTLLHLATKTPARVEKMILVGTTTYYTKQSRAIQRQVMPESDEIPWETFRKRHLRGDDQIRALLTQFHNFADSYDDMSFTPPHLATIQAQTLIVHGDRDEHFPVSIAHEMYTSIPNAYLWITPNGNHIPIMGERATHFSQTALEFLQGEWEKS
jgi:pimeloyl-ACP methyl ester carboxylesterase